jgi:phage tail-like protein
MAGYKIPGWMTKGFSLEASLRMGSAPYNPGAFQPRYVAKPTGQYNPGGGYENRDVAKPTGAYRSEQFESRAVQRPTGAYNPGAFVDGEKDLRDPWGNYFFSLEMNGTEIGHFHEMSGMKTTATTFEIEEGGHNGSTHKRAAQSRWENIVLKNGECVAQELLQWRDRFLRDEFGEQKNTQIAVVLRDNDGMELRRYDVVRPWPVSWEGPGLNSGSSEVAVTTLEIGHEGILVDGGSAPTPPPDPEPEPPKETNFEPVQFEFDQHDLERDEQKKVDDINKTLAENPDIKEVWVEGHTCNMGSHAYNQTLSEQRAEQVAGQIRAKNPGVTVHTKGYSYDHPVASNASKGGRESNRRTQVWTTPRSGPRPGELQ